jgi:hypothetical protein
MGTIMSTEFKTFRDVNTGQVAKYPARYADIFSNLEEVDPDTAACIDCLVKLEPEDEVYPPDLVDDEGEPFTAFSSEDATFDDKED